MGLMAAQIEANRLYPRGQPRLMLIGTTGRKQAGKDSFAARLVEAHGFTRVTFADPMREFALALDPLVDGHYRLSEIVRSLGWDVAKESIPEVRRTLQRLGRVLVPEPPCHRDDGCPACDEHGRVMVAQVVPA